MSKAEEKSLIAYPQKIQWVGNQWDGAPFDVNSESRVAYKQGYEQAENDLELTVDDIMKLDALLIEMWNRPSNEDKYQEVLKQFKAQKGEEYEKRF